MRREKEKYRFHNTCTLHVQLINENENKNKNQIENLLNRTNDQFPSFHSISATSEILRMNSTVDNFQDFTNTGNVRNVGTSPKEFLHNVLSPSLSSVMTNDEKNNENENEIIDFHDGSMCHTSYKDSSSSSNNNKKTNDCSISSNCDNEKNNNLNVNSEKILLENPVDNIKGDNEEKEDFLGIEKHIKRSKKYESQIEQNDNNSLYDKSLSKTFICDGVNDTCTMMNVDEKIRGEIDVEVEVEKKQMIEGNYQSNIDKWLLCRKWSAKTIRLILPALIK